MYLVIFGRGPVVHDCPKPRAMKGQPWRKMAGEFELLDATFHFVKCVSKLGI